MAASKDDHPEPRPIEAYTVFLNHLDQAKLSDEFGLISSMALSMWMREFDIQLTAEQIARINQDEPIIKDGKLVSHDIDMKANGDIVGKKMKERFLTQELGAFRSGIKVVRYIEPDPSGDPKKALWAEVMSGLPNINKEEGLSVDHKLGFFSKYGVGPKRVLALDPVSILRGKLMIGNEHIDGVPRQRDIGHFKILELCVPIYLQRIAEAHQKNPLKRNPKPLAEKLLETMYTRADESWFLDIEKLRNACFQYAAGWRINRLINGQ